MWHTDFKDFIATLQSCYGPSLRDFALELGVSHSQVSRWLAGETDPDPGSCEKLRTLYLRAVDEGLLPSPEEISFHTTEPKKAADYIRRFPGAYDREHLEHFGIHPPMPSGTVRQIPSTRHRSIMLSIPESLRDQYEKYFRLFGLTDYSKSPDGVPDLGTCMFRLQNSSGLSDAIIGHHLDMTAERYRNIRDGRQLPESWELARICDYIYHDVLNRGIYDEIFAAESRYDYVDGY